jgi:hypothetical protein
LADRGFAEEYFSLEPSICLRTAFQDATERKRENKLNLVLTAKKHFASSKQIPGKYARKLCIL